MIPQYSLQLFKLLLDQKPTGLPEALITEGKQEYERLERESQTPEQVENSMIQFGKKFWPFMQAQYDFMEKYGKEKKKEVFLQNLSDELKEKWESFETGGGSMHNYKNAENYENFFSPEEDLQIESAVFESEKKTNEYLTGLAKDEKREEYQAEVEKFTTERDEMLNKIEELRALGSKIKDQDMIYELENDVYFFQKGFAEIEERPTVAKVQGRIDWYKGQLGIE